MQDLKGLRDCNFQCKCSNVWDRSKFIEILNQFLNLITWVQFENTECAGDSGDNGTCFTNNECEVSMKYNLRKVNPIGARGLIQTLLTCLNQHFQTMILVWDVLFLTRTDVPGRPEN